MQLSNESTKNYLKRVYNKHGFLSVCFVIFLRIINKAIDLKILNVFYKDHITYVDRGSTEHFFVKKLDQQQIAEYFGDGFNDITKEYTQYLLTLKADCFCVFSKKNNQFVAYSWFASNEFSAGILNYKMTLKKDLKYTFKVFTDPEFRGRQLHGLMMKNALDYYKTQNKKAIIGYTYSENFDSVKSNNKMGSKTIGYVFVLKVINKSFVVKCGLNKKYGVSFE